MKTILKIFIFSLSIVTIFGENCDKYGILFYEDLGCTPHYEESKPCPTKYTCATGLESSNDKCYFRGKEYAEGEEVDESLLVPPCDKACICVRGQFNCAILDCPEWLGRPVTPGCYRKYSLTSCCSTGDICPPFEGNAKCVVDGKEYREGERFEPANTCLNCICQKGFQGKFEEPFCKKKTCNTQLRRRVNDLHNKCAPLFGKKTDEVLCCPYNGSVCPDGTEVIKGEGKGDDNCKYGDKTLKVGQKFEKLNFVNSYSRKFDKIECECVIPPLLTCTQV